MKMTEQPKTPNFYPINFEKLKGESVGTIPYFLGILSFSEDYEHFDKIKHLLIIPEPRKSLEEIQKELDDKFEELWVKTKRKFFVSKESADYKFKQFCKKQDADFEYARENGFFPLKYTLDYSKLSVFGDGSNITPSFVIKQGNNHEGYYTFGNCRSFRYYMPTKPNFVSRFCMDKLLGFKWIDEK
jgi:hypothetical protein